MTVDIEIAVVDAADGAQQRAADRQVLDPEPLVSKLRLGSEHAEIIAADQVAVEADLVVDVQSAVEFVPLELDVEKAFVAQRDSGFDSEIGRVVAGEGR